MRTRITTSGVLLGLVAAAGAGGCSTMDNTGKGAGIGGALGTGAGLAVGAATHHPLLGAAVGGLTGAGVGAAVGANQDQKEQDKRDIQYANAVATAQAQQAQQRMGLTDVIHMCNQGHDPQVVINQIRNTGSTFQLSANDLDFLKANNVPPQVIAEMQSARPAAGPVVVGGPPRPAVIYQDGPPVVIYRRPPPPAFYVGYGWGPRRYWW